MDKECLRRKNYKIMLMETNTITYLARFIYRIRYKLFLGSIITCLLTIYFTRFSFWGFTPGWIHGSITDTNSCINSKDKSQKFISAETSVS